MQQQLYSYPAGATVNGNVYPERSIHPAALCIIGDTTHPAETIANMAETDRIAIGVLLFVQGEVPQDYEPGLPVDIEENGRIRRTYPNAKPDEEAIAARARAAIVAQIADLEAQQTPRRIREAALTDEGRAWLADLDAQIAALRAQLAV